MARARGTDTPQEFQLKRIPTSNQQMLDRMTKFAASHEYPSAFQSGAMVSVYSQTKGCTPIALIAQGDGDQPIATLTATVFMDAGIVVGKLMSHVACRGGPLFTPTDIGVEAGKALLSTLTDLVKKNSLYTRIYPLHEYDAQISLLSHLGFVKEDWLNYLIDLTKGQQDIWDRLSKHRRKGIRRGEQLGLEIVDVSTRHDLDVLYGVLLESHEAAKIPLQDKSLFEGLYSIMASKKWARMVIAYKGEAPIASRVALTFSGIIYDWYAGSIEAGDERYANEFLVWKILSWGCESGYRLFDFGGAGKPDEEYGPREFKRRFGGSLTNFGRYTVVHRPKMLKLAKNLYEVKRRI